MASGGGGGEKTEKATAKRRRDERKKGNIFSSKDIVAAFFMLFVFLTLRLFGKTMYTVCAQSLTYWLGFADGSYKFNTEGIRSMLFESVKTILIVAGPIMLVGILANIIFTGVQTRFLFSTEALKIKFNRLNPLEGIKKLFSLKSVVELLKSLLKISVLVAIIYNEVKNRLVDFSKLYDIDVQSSFIYMCSSAYSIIMMISGIFVGIGIIDFGYQWWEYEKNLKMTKQEIKEEYKQMEGDPLIKGQIKQKQREMAQRRMMQQVPESDVVVRNPTHFAVAIKYDPQKSMAPIVVAKGQDNIAMKIVEIAEQNNVTMTENKPLARALYADVELGREIPVKYYQEVAEILAWVYDINGKDFPV